jgi:hypothetical protein
LKQRLASVATLLLLIAAPAANPALHAQDLSPEMGEQRNDRPIRNLAVAPEDIGVHWFVVPESIEEIGSEHLGPTPRPSDPLALFQARYRNEVDYPGREAAFLVAEFQDAEHAELALHEYLNYVVIGNLLPEVRWRWPAEEVAAGDQGYRFGYCVRGAFTAGYLFARDTYVSGVLMRGSEAEEEELLTEATDFASRQEALLPARPPEARSAP